MEKTQVLVIHGGTSFTNDEDFYTYLKKFKIDLSYAQNSDWKSNLQVDLGDKYKVFKPTMPNKQKADYNAWKIWFEKYFEFLTSKKIILIGHSLGGIFLAKYLSENEFVKQISQLHLVSPVFDHGFDKELGNFKVENTKLNNVSKQCDKIYLYHSTDDSVVPFNHSVEYQKRLEHSELTTLENKGHINQEELPELVERIKKN
jgi:predicted alpha/beta hydrolase family esterase